MYRGITRMFLRIFTMSLALRLQSPRYSDKRHFRESLSTSVHMPSKWRRRSSEYTAWSSKVSAVQTMWARHGRERDGYGGAVDLFIPRILDADIETSFGNTFGSAGQKVLKYMLVLSSSSYDSIFVWFGRYVAKTNSVGRET